MQVVWLKLFKYIKEGQSCLRIYIYHDTVLYFFFYL